MLAGEIPLLSGPKSLPCNSLAESGALLAVASGMVFWVLNYPNFVALSLVGSLRATDRTWLSLLLRGGGL